MISKIENICKCICYVLLTGLYWICNIVMFPALILQLAFFILHKVGAGYISELLLNDPLLWIPIMVFGASFILSFIIYNVRKHIVLEDV